MRSSRQKRFLTSTIGLFIIIGVVLLIGGGLVFAKFGASPTQTSTSDINLQKGLIDWWPMNGNANDATPYARNATVNGATLTTDRKGTSNSAYSFVGTSSNYLEVPTWGQITGASPLTESIWFKTTSSANMSLMEFGAGPSRTAALLQLYSNSIRIDGNSCAAQVSSAPYIDGNWHLATGTYDGSVFRLFVDGVFQTSISCTQNVTSSDLAIGSLDSFVGHGRYFTGSLDDARVYNRALSANEVAALYKQYNPAIKTDSSEGGLVGWWEMDNNAKDSTPYNDNGTTAGISYVSDAHAVANRAMSFTGSSYMSVGANNVFNTPTYTYSAWVMPINGSSYTVFSKANQINISLANLAPKVSASCNGTSYSVTNTYNTYPLAAGAWSLLTITSDATTIRLYENGVFRASSPLGCTISGYNSNSLFIGATDSSGTNNFNGVIDDARVYNTTFGTTQILKLYTDYYSQLSLGGGGQSGGINLQSGLVGSWPLTNAALDATPYSDNGTISVASASTDRKGRANSSYAFNGSSGYIQIPDNAVMDTTTGTWSTWVYLNSIAAGHGAAVMVKASNSGSFNGISLVINPSGAFEVAIKSAATVATINSSVTVSTGTWNFLTVVYNGNGTATLYLNGSSVGSVTAPSGWSFGSAYPLRIGTATDSFWQTLNGSVADVRYYSRALSTSEITALYQEYQ